MKTLCKKSSLILVLVMIGGSLVFGAGEKPPRPVAAEDAVLSAPVEPAGDSLSENALSALGPVTGSTTQPTLAEIDQLKTFLREHAPHHFRALQLGQMLPDAKFWAEAVARYHAYLATKQVLPKLAAIRLNRLNLEDELLSTVMNIRLDPANAEMYRTHVHQTVLELENNRIEEQQWRVDQLKTMLDESQKRLDAELRDNDRMVDNRTSRIMNRVKNRATTNRSER